VLPRNGTNLGSFFFTARGGGRLGCVVAKLLTSDNSTVKKSNTSVNNLCKKGRFGRFWAGNEIAM